MFLTIILPCRVFSCPDEVKLERAHLRKIAIYFCLLIKYTDFFLNGPLKDKLFQGAAVQVIFTPFLYSFVLL